MLSPFTYTAVFCITFCPLGTFSAPDHSSPPIQSTALPNPLTPDSFLFPFPRPLSLLLPPFTPLISSSIIFVLLSSLLTGFPPIPADVYRPYQVSLVLSYSFGLILVLVLVLLLLRCSGGARLGYRDGQCGAHAMRLLMSLHESPLNRDERGMSKRLEFSP